MFVCWRRACRGLPASKSSAGSTQSSDQAFHVRVLVPCYKVCLAARSQHTHSLGLVVAVNTLCLVPLLLLMVTQLLAPLHVTWFATS